jgi:hypothetical protein
MRGTVSEVAVGSCLAALHEPVGADGTREARPRKVLTRRTVRTRPDRGPRGQLVLPRQRDTKGVRRDGLKRGASDTWKAPPTDAQWIWHLA